MANDDPPAPDARVITAYLDDVDLELDAAKRLVADPRRDRPRDTKIQKISSKPMTDLRY
jgi:hypothetical protein